MWALAVWPSQGVGLGWGDTVDGHTDMPWGALSVLIWNKYTIKSAYVYLHAFRQNIQEDCDTYRCRSRCVQVLLTKIKEDMDTYRCRYVKVFVLEIHANNLT